MKFTSIGGGQEFCIWLGNTFNGRASNDDGSVERVWVSSLSHFNRQLMKQTLAFRDENLDEIKEIRAALKGAGGVELSISW